LSTREVDMRELVAAVNQLASDLNRVVSYDTNELYISTASERQERARQRNEGN
jgi:hypothetical protein